jgi:superfamily I DNA/RNA helicase/RecB family exonuclease
VTGEVLTAGATLTAEQRAIVEVDLQGPWLVDAGAGTGKTFTLVQRARALIERGVLRPSELLVITFTHSAASEIAERLDRELDAASHNRPACGTFHGIAGRLLREFAYDVGTSPEIRQIDDGRARGVFHRAFAELLAGRLGVDLSAFPLLDRTQVLERSLATMAIRLKSDGIAFAEVFDRARAATSYLETINFDAINKLLKNGSFSKGQDWPVPSPPRTSHERKLEAVNERKNITVVAALFEKFDQLLDQDHLVLYGDVIGRATHMIRSHVAIGDTLRKRWKHAIVDEFQDTSAGQIEFLKAIFGDDLVPLLAVGDVRQSIFEFSGARPDNIIEFRKLARRSLPLTENRRSVKPILDVAWHTLDGLNGVSKELNTKLSAQRGSCDPTCVRLGIFAGPDALQQEASCIAGTIAELVANGAPPRRCAVLLRAGIRAGIFAQALLERGIAVQLFGGAGFFTAPEIREVIAWLRIASDPTDPYAITAALQSASIGLSDGGLAHLAREKQLARAALLGEIPAEFARDERERLERFRRIAHIVSRLTAAPLVDAVQSVILASGAEVARIANVESAMQVRANLEKFTAFAADFAKDRPLAVVADLVAELDEREAFELDLPIAEIEGDRVAIMTIHKAKGLEWDHVFVADVKPGIFPGQGRGNDDVAVFDPKTGALALKHGIDGRPTLRWWLTKKTHDSSGHFIEPEKVSKAEEFRLLYVALTRARDCVYVTARESNHGKVSKCYAAVGDWVMETSGSLDPHLIAGASDLSAPSRVPTNPGMQLTLDLWSRLERAATQDAQPAERLGTLSYTAMEAFERCPRRARYHYFFGLPEFSDEPPPQSTEVDGEPRPEVRNPTRYGRVIHRVLEWIARDRLAGALRPIAMLLDEAIEEEEWTPSAAERDRALAAAQSTSEYLAEYEPLAIEQRFDVTLDGVALGGYIDLIARDPNGTPVLIDYKTGRTEAGYYNLQFALYAYAVRDEYRDVQTRLLRISDAGVAFEAVAPASFARLRASVAQASVMADEPRPGDHCQYCPYAHNPCGAARE